MRGAYKPRQRQARTPGKPNDSLDRIAGALRSGLYDNAERRAKALFGGNPADSVEMSQPKYLDYLRRNIADPKFVQSLLIEIGPERFRVDLAEACGVDPDVVWPLPPGGPDVSK